MKRRGFLQGLGALVGVTAAGVLLPEVEPVRRYWQVGRNAPFGRGKSYLNAGYDELATVSAEDMRAIEASLRGRDPAVLRFEESLLRHARNGDPQALAYRPVIEAVRAGKPSSGIYAGPPIFPKREQPDEYGPEPDWRDDALLLGDDDEPGLASHDPAVYIVGARAREMHERIHAEWKMRNGSTIRFGA